MNTLTRPPAVADSFYPRDAAELAAAVDRCIAAGKERLRGHDSIKAVIVPHAGYQYSGPIAGTAYATLRYQAATISRVVLLGPAHTVPVDGIAVTGAARWNTPLGDVRIDTDACRQLVHSGLAHVDDDAHAPEHSLEVQLPFLQRSLNHFSIVPLVVGHCDPLTVATVLDELWGGPETLFVVSSDLSHYLDATSASLRDAQTTRMITGNAITKITGDDACGAGAIRGLLLAARERGQRLQPLDVRHSGDVCGTKDRVVGYGAFALSDHAPANLTTVARRMIRNALLGRRLPLPAIDDTVPAAWAEPRGAFVSLHRRGALRGCVGTLEAEEPLAVAVARAALAAAFDDPRFSPLQPDEYLDLEVSVSVLSTPQPLAATGWSDLRSRIRRGDGLVVESRGHRATFLPVVWDDVPDPEDFLKHLWHKAGLSPGDWPDGIRVERYRAEVVHDG